MAIRARLFRCRNFKKKVSKMYGMVAKRTPYTLQGTCHFLLIPTTLLSDTLILDSSKLVAAYLKTQALNLKRECKPLRLLAKNYRGQGILKDTWFECFLKMSIFFCPLLLHLQLLQLLEFSKLPFTTLVRFWMIIQHWRQICENILLFRWQHIDPVTLMVG